MHAYSEVSNIEFNVIHSQVSVCRDLQHKSVVLMSK